jgi:hypothetical protein
MRWLNARGHEVHLQATVRIDALTDDGALVAGSAHVRRAGGVVIAVGPHQLARTVAPELARDRADLARALAQVERLTYEPISTVYLGYAQQVFVPSGLVRLDDRPGQWLFDRRDILSRRQPGAPALETLFAVVISAGGPHDSLAHADLVAAVDAQLRRSMPTLPSLVWSKVIAERRATFACTPDAERPRAGRLCDGVYLAGDYTDPQAPATLESAVKSGRLAAEALLADQSD